MGEADVAAGRDPQERSHRDDEAAAARGANDRDDDTDDVVRARTRRAHLAPRRKRIADSGALAPHGVGRTADPEGGPDTDGADAPAEEMPAERVVRFGLVDGNLTLATELGPTGGMLRVRIAGLAGPVRVHAAVRSRRRAPRAVGEAAPPTAAEQEQYLTLTHSRSQPDVDGVAGADAGAVADPGASVRTSIMLRGGERLQISRTARSPVELCTVSLYQSRRLPRGRRHDAADDHRADDRVALQVRCMDPQTHRVTASVRVSAPNMAELLRRHPVETGKYLAPIFRDFGQEEAVFAAGSELAWQVFAEEMTPPTGGEVAKRVDGLLARFDGEDFDDRQAASRELADLGGPAALLLRARPPGRPSPERRARVGTFLAGYPEVAAEQAAELGQDVDYLIRCFTYHEDPRIREAAAARLRRRVADGRSSEAAADLVPGADRGARIDATARLRESLAADTVPTPLPPNQTGAGVE